MEKVKEWIDDEEEEIINLINESESSEEDCPNKEQQEDVKARKEEGKMGCREDNAKEEFPRMDQSSRKRKPEEEPEVKRRKEFESWEDLEDLMESRMVTGNCRKGDEGPSYLFTEVWQEVWEDDLEKEHRRNFYSN